MPTVYALEAAAHVKLYPDSLVEQDGVWYFLARRDGTRVVGMLGDGVITGDVVGELEGMRIILGPCSSDNAQALRAGVPWTGPRCLGLATSVGLGDRLGLATPGHIRAVRGSGVMPILAQQSIRELARTNRTPEAVMDAATWGVLQEGYTDGFGSDADHLQQPEDLDRTAAAGFTMFTIDPGLHVVNEADTLPAADLETRLSSLDYDLLGSTPEEFRSRYEGRTFPLEGGGAVALEGDSFLRAAVKYGGAIQHTVRMYRHLVTRMSRPFELEVSVDETESPTSPAEHYFFAAELRRLGVKWVSMAPRFLGRFEKGVDYIGDIEAFRASFAEHVAVMRTLGPYKMSIHSGSDKFSLYPLIAAQVDGLVHLKTAGTSYLEALRAVCRTDPALFREILDFARGLYDQDKATYHVSAEVSRVPAGDAVPDAELPALLDDFHARQVFHVTFGSVLTEAGGARFRDRILAVLDTEEEIHYETVRVHLAKHIAPFRKG